MRNMSNRERKGTLRRIRDRERMVTLGRMFNEARYHGGIELSYGPSLKTLAIFPGPETKKIVREIREKAWNDGYTSGLNS